MPATFKRDLADYLGQLGISEKSLRIIHFGGVVGKLALITVSCVLAIAVVALKSGSTAILWGCLAAIAILGLAALVIIAFHAHKHPLEATLEGCEIVALKSLEQAIAVKGYPKLPETPAVPPPKELIGAAPSGDGETR